MAMILTKKDFEILEENGLNYGVELEISDRHLREMLEIYSYHEGEVEDGDYFKLERDGSLEGSYTGELISKKLKIKDFEEAIKRMRELVGDEFTINKSMGFHHHISFNKNVRYSFPFLKSLRQEFFKLIKKHLPANKEITKRYYRGYASRSLNIKNLELMNITDRQNEFNLTHMDLYSRDEGNHLEWRSINLMGVKTFDGIQMVHECVLKAISNTLRKKDLKASKVYTNEILDYKIEEKEVIPQLVGM